jgi:hypothetical protein
MPRRKPANKILVMKPATARAKFSLSEAIEFAIEQRGRIATLRKCLTNLEEIIKHREQRDPESPELPGWRKSLERARVNLRDSERIVTEQESALRDELPCWPVLKESIPKTNIQSIDHEVISQNDLSALFSLRDAAADLEHGLREKLRRGVAVEPGPLTLPAPKLIKHALAFRTAPKRRRRVSK